MHLTKAKPLQKGGYIILILSLFLCGLSFTIEDIFSIFPICPPQGVMKTIKQGGVEAKVAVEVPNNNNNTGNFLPLCILY